MSTSAVSETRHAYCDRQGVIHFGRATPRSYLHIAYAQEPMLTDTVEALARHSRTKPLVLLVPGVREAASNREAEYAAAVFANRVRARLANGQEQVRVRQVQP